jgi:hypothetical protein
MGVTRCPESGLWMAELRNTDGALIPDPQTDGVLDVIAYGAECDCGGKIVQTVQLFTA